MNGYIDGTGLYYEGVRLHALDLEVPLRPSPEHRWEGSWIIDSAAALLDHRATEFIDAQDRLQFEHLFDLENRVRALEGKLPITRAVYRQALIDRWKLLNP